MVRRSFGIASFVFAAGMILGVASANAEANAVQKACSADWKAAKAANTVKPGQTWSSFYSECAKAKAAAAPAAAAPAPTAAAAPAATPAPAAPVNEKAVPPEPGTAAATAPAATTAAGKPLTPGQIAAHERIKKCGAEWTAAKEANKIPAGQKWPQYWSACNKRLKATGQ